MGAKYTTLMSEMGSVRIGLVTVVQNVSYSGVPERLKCVSLVFLSMGEGGGRNRHQATEALQNGSANISLYFIDTS